MAAETMPIGFRPPPYADENGVLFKESEEPILIKNPHQWIIQIQNRAIQMERDILDLNNEEKQGVILDSPVKARLARAYNTLAGQIAVVYQVLKATDDTTNRRIEVHYLEILRQSNLFASDLYSSLMRVKDGGGKLLALQMVQQRQEEAIHSLQDYMAQGIQGGAGFDFGGDSKELREKEHEWKLKEGLDAQRAELEKAIVARVVQQLKGKENIDRDEILESVRTASVPLTAPSPMPEQENRASPSPPAPALAACREHWGELFERLADIGAGTRRETPHMRPMRMPGTYDGTYSNFRSWWLSVEDYIDVHEAAMPRDLIKIIWVGSLLTDDAHIWFRARRTSFRCRGIEDTWTEFKEALEQRFADKLEQRWDYGKMDALRYEGSIEGYLDHLGLLNSRVGVSGIALQHQIISAMPKDIVRLVFEEFGGIPDGDGALIKAVRAAGLCAEASERIFGRSIFGSDESSEAGGSRQEAATLAGGQEKPKTGASPARGPMPTKGAQEAGKSKLAGPPRSRPPPSATKRKRDDNDEGLKEG